MDSKEKVRELHVNAAKFKGSTPLVEEKYYVVKLSPQDMQYMEQLAALAKISESEKAGVVIIDAEKKPAFYKFLKGWVK